MKLLISIVLVAVLFVQVADCVIFSWLWSVDPLEQHSLSNHTSSSNRNPVKEQTYCRKDRQCGAAKYCHRHFGTCRKCKKTGGKCRRDHVCCKGLECVFGSCRRVVIRGNYLSRCKKDKHCKKGLCCAKSHGEFVCKPMLRKKQICSVLEGGVAYAVNHGCPCDDGLVCKRWSVTRSNGKRTKKDRTKIRRCQRI